MPLPGESASTAKRSANDFIFGKEIGEGSFSTVYLAKDIHSQKEYAIKVCEKRQILREKKVEYIKREKEVLNLLSDTAAFFVRLYCTFQDSDRLYFVLSYAKNGEMLQLINKLGCLEMEQTRFYAAEIILALEMLHAKQIIHRDLKPENILLDERMHILITDFGSAKILSETVEEKDPAEKKRRNSFVGTAQYVSPEILTDTTVSFGSDLWGFGCILFQMITGNPPFLAGSEYLIFQKILKLDYSFPADFPPLAKNIIEGFLKLDPNQRLGVTDSKKYTSIRSHEFFEIIDFDNLGEPPVKNSPTDSKTFFYQNSTEPGLNDEKVSKLQLESLYQRTAEDLSEDDSPVENSEIHNEAKPTKVKSITSILPNLTQDEIDKRLQDQKNNKWHIFVENHLILKQGIIEKKKGLFARRRMFLITMGPRIFYVDPNAMILKGEIPWTNELRVEPKNFKTFFVHTPNRTYYLEDPEGYALNWCKTIEDVHNFYFPRSEQTS